MKLFFKILFFSLWILSSDTVFGESVIIVGAQWGDEGKGKIIDYLAENADIVVRAQGGNNAGHTVKVGDQVYKFHLIPSGILYEQCQCYIGGGVVLDPQVLLKEIRDLESKGLSLRGKLWISPYANVIMPYHISIDKLQEKSKGGSAIGTTGRGIGPCYADKANRCGIRFIDFIYYDQFSIRLDAVVGSANNYLSALKSDSLINKKDLLENYKEYADALRPYLLENMEQVLYDAIKSGKKVLLEGAQGTFLDVTFGTVPFVTSSSTIAAGICCGAGVGPTSIHHTIAVAKAYTTRVGNGPLPTEVIGSDLFLDPKTAGEYGTTTGRQRRIGWFDAVVVRSAVKINSADLLALTKLDILDTVPTIKICVGYTYQDKHYDYIPQNVDFKYIQPIYEEMPGWLTATSHIKKYQDLPENARRYCERIQELCNCRIVLVSVGAERNQTIIV